MEQFWGNSLHLRATYKINSGCWTVLRESGGMHRASWSWVKRNGKKSSRSWMWKLEWKIGYSLLFLNHFRKRFEHQQKFLEEERKRRQFEEQKQKLRLLSSVKPKVGPQQQWPRWFPRGFQWLLVECFTLGSEWGACRTHQILESIWNIQSLAHSCCNASKVCKWKPTFVK